MFIFVSVSRVRGDWRQDLVSTRGEVEGWREEGRERKVKGDEEGRNDKVGTRRREQSSSRRHGVNMVGFC